MVLSLLAFIMHPMLQGNHSTYIHILYLVMHPPATPMVRPVAFLVQVRNLVQEQFYVV